MLTQRNLLGFIGAAFVGALSVAGTVRLRASAERRAERAGQAEAENRLEKVLVGMARLVDRDESRAIAGASLLPLRAILATSRSQDALAPLVATLDDAFTTESWWEPFRRDFTVSGIAFAPGGLAAVTPKGRADPAFRSLIGEAAERGDAVQFVVAHDGVLLATARRIPLIGRRGSAVLVLGRELGTELAALLPSPSDAIVIEQQGQAILAIGGKTTRAAIYAPVHSSTVKVARRSLGNLVLAVATDAGPVIAEARAGLPPEAMLGLGGVLALLLLWFTRSPGVAARAPPSLTLTEPDGIWAPLLEREMTSAPRWGSVGRYALMDLLGEGGMAQVYTALSFGAEGFQRKFVVKRLRPELANDKQAITHFIDEAKLAASLVQSNIIPVFDFGTAEGQYFMAMEYILGRDLGKIVERSIALGRGPLPLPILLWATSETLKALDYAHTRCADDGQPLSLVHRDVSPSNILLSVRGEVKLFDFGIVKAEGRTMGTNHGVVVGNVSFMSPEQARGLFTDARADLFSLGLVIFYCATGRTLFDGDTMYDFLLRAATGPTDADWEVIDALPAPLPGLLRVALQTEPSARFASAAAFARALSGVDLATSQEASSYVQSMFGDELAQEEMRLNNSPALSQSAEMPTQQGHANGNRDL